MLAFASSYANGPLLHFVFLVLTVENSKIQRMLLKLLDGALNYNPFPFLATVAVENCLFVNDQTLIRLES